MTLSNLKKDNIAYDLKNIHKWVKYCYELFS